jgi:hypothetical protein
MNSITGDMYGMAQELRDYGMPPAMIARADELCRRIAPVEKAWQAMVDEAAEEDAIRHLAQIATGNVVFLERRNGKLVAQRRARA